MKSNTLNTLDVKLDSLNIKLNYIDVTLDNIKIDKLNFLSLEDLGGLV